MRLNRVRRRKEKLRFWDELLIIPKWLLVVVGLLYAAALGIAIPVNLAQRYNPYGNDMFPPELRDNPVLASFALAGIVTSISILMATFIFLTAYVNRDASRRGMNSALWTILILIFLPTWGLIGFVEGGDGLAAGGVPEAHRPVVAGAGQVVAVGREGDAAHPAGVASQGGNDLAAGGRGELTPQSSNL